MQPKSLLSILHAIPGNHLFILPDAPTFTIAGATDAYLTITNTIRESIVGKSIFEVYTNECRVAHGEKSLVASLNKVVENKNEDTVDDYNFNLSNSVDEPSEKRMCRLIHKPVLSDSNQISFIIHTVDYTKQTEPLKEQGEFRIFAEAIALDNDTTPDVTTERNIEEAIKTGEKQKRLYEAINSSVPDLIYVFDLNYRFTYANKALLTMWGLSWEQAIGKGLLENGYEPWHAEMHEREIDEVVATKQPIRGEVSFPHATFGRRIYDYILVPVINEKGEVEAIAGTTRDITEIKQAEQNIRESNERFRNLADESPMFVFIIDPGPLAQVSFWNKTWLEYTGQNIDDALGRSWDGILHPDDVAVVMEYYFPAFQNKSAYFIPAVRVMRHDGVYRWHAFKGSPRYTTVGDFNGYVGVGYDIHEQKLGEQIIKQSEAQLQAKVAERTVELEKQRNLFDNILQNSSNGISVSEMIRDESGNIIDANTILANDAAVKHIGLPKDVYLSKSAAELDPNILSSPYGKMCLNTLLTGEPAISQYYMDITGRWQELTISKMDDDHLIHIFTDITPIKQAQLQLEQIVVELKRSNANLEEFAFAASHDLKEPIRKIRTFSDRLKNNFKGRLLEEDQYYFQRMEKATERMQNLIDDLLEYSHVSNAIDYLDKIDLNKKVLQVLDDLELEVAEKNAHVIFGTLPIINGHRRQILQLLQNLITNALKFGTPGINPEVKISAAVVEGEKLDSFNLPAELKNKRYNLIEISDNGIGFKQEYAEKIFKLFQRLHGRAEYEGTGIGLSIVRKVVENHKGFIRAESCPGEGATFKILLPID